MDKGLKPIKLDVVFLRRLERVKMDVNKDIVLFLNYEKCLCVTTIMKQRKSVQ